MAGRTRVHIESSDGQIGTFHADSPCSPTGNSYTRYVGSREKGNREIRNQRKKTEAEGTKPEGGCQRSKSRTDPDDSGGGGERKAKPSKKGEDRVQSTHPNQNGQDGREDEEAEGNDEAGDDGVNFLQTNCQQLGQPTVLSAMGFVLEPGSEPSVTADALV